MVPRVEPGVEFLQEPFTADALNRGSERYSMGSTLAAPTESQRRDKGPIDDLDGTE